MTAPADLDPPPFNSYLFWYAVIHCAVGVGTFAAFTAYGAFITSFGFAGLAQVENQRDAIQGPWIAASVLFGIALAFIVGRRHGIVLRQGFLGYVAGCIISGLVRLPLVLGSLAANHRFPYPRSLAPIVTIILAYALVLTVLMARKRRSSLNRRRRAALIEPFT